MTTTPLLSTTTAPISNTTHIYDTYDLFIHPHWKQFPLIPDVCHYIIGVYITIVGISGTLGNLLVIYIFGTTKNLRTPSNMFVVNLALSDLTFSAVNGFPLLTISAFNRRWIFGKIACELYGLTGGVFGLMSINTMAVIAIDRFNVITKPVKASHSLSYRKAFIMLVIVWIWSAVWTLPPLFGWGAYIPEGFQTSCTFDYLTRNTYFRSYIMCLYICGFAVPLSTIIYCYYFIYRAVAIHEKEMGKMAKKLNAEIRQGQAAQKAEIKTAKISMIIITTYLLSWLPYATVALIAQFGPSEYVTPYVSEIPVMFAKASAMHNPIIYALSHPRFRDELNKRFPWLMCCCPPKPKESTSVVENKSKVSRMDSVTSNCPGGAVSNISSEISNLSDSAYTSNTPDGGDRHVSMKMHNMPQPGGPDNPENNSALIRDILQAFVGVVSTQGSRQVPVYLPPQLLAQYAATGQFPPPTSAPAAGGDGAAQQGVYAISHGAVPSQTVPNPSDDQHQQQPGSSPPSAATATSDHSQHKPKQQQHQQQLQSVTASVHPQPPGASPTKAGSENVAAREDGDREDSSSSAVAAAAGSACAGAGEGEGEADAVQPKLNGGHDNQAYSQDE